MILVITLCKYPISIYSNELKKVQGLYLFKNK